MKNLEPLCKHVPGIRFGPKAIDTLQPLLNNTENNFSTAVVNSHLDLMLDSKFKTLMHGRTFTQSAFKTVCDSISSCLFKTICDIAKFSKAEAAVVFSMAVKAAFSVCLNGKTLHINSDNEITAVSNVSTVGLTNKIFCDNVNKIVETCKDDVYLAEAFIKGGKLTLDLAYMFESSVKSGMLDSRLEPVAYRLQLSNVNNVSDYRKIKLIVKFGNEAYASLSTTEGGSLKETLYYGLNTAKLFDNELAETMIKAAETPLGFTGNKSVDNPIAKKLLGAFTSLGFTREEATRVIRRALYSVRENNKLKITRVHTLSVFPEKTFLEIFVSMLLEQLETDKTAKSKHRLAKAVSRFVTEREAMRG